MGTDCVLIIFRIPGSIQQSIAYKLEFVRVGRCVFIAGMVCGPGAKLADKELCKAGQRNLLHIQSFLQPVFQLFDALFP